MEKEKCWPQRMATRMRTLSADNCVGSFPLSITMVITINST